MVSTSGTRVRRSRKAASLWLSWILLFTFAIVLSAFSYRFIIPLVTDTTEDVKQVVFNTDECRQVSISLEAVCQSSTAQHLNMTIRNRNYLRVDELRFQLFDSARTPIKTVSVNTTLAPNRAKKYSVNGSSSTLGFIKATPILKKEGLTVVCSEKAASTSTIPSC
ncbi:MAG: hypothetical protein ACE5DM_00360 [Candidatus Nanoarchaeia archaeon]